MCFLCSKITLWILNKWKINKRGGPNKNQDGEGNQKFYPIGIYQNYNLLDKYQRYLETEDLIRKWGKRLQKYFEEKRY